MMELACPDREVGYTFAGRTSKAAAHILNYDYFYTIVAIGMAYAIL